MSFRKGDIFVHTDTTYPDGAPVADGFDVVGNLVAHPMGGGLQLVVTSTEVPEFGIPDELERTAIFRRALFSIEDVAETFEGWTDGRHWNGWAMPHFEFVHPQKVVIVLNPIDGRYDTVSDSFITVTCNGEEERWCANLIVLPDDEVVKVYPVGAGSWIWTARRDYHGPELPLRIHGNRWYLAGGFAVLSAGRRTSSQRSRD